MRTADIGKYVKAEDYERVYAELVATRQEQERRRVQLASYFCEVHLPEPDEPGPNQCLCCDAAHFAKQWTEAKQEHTALLVGLRAVVQEWRDNLGIVDLQRCVDEIERLLPSISSGRERE